MADPLSRRIDIPWLHVLLSPAFSLSTAMSDFVLTRTGSVIDFRPVEKGSSALVFSKGSWARFEGTIGDLIESRPISEKEANHLTGNDIWLTESSKATLNLLVEGIRDTKVIVSMFDCYKYYFEIYRKKYDIKPRKIERSDIDRLLFEVLCFATFNIVVRAVSGYMEGKAAAQDHGSDEDKVRCFNQKLLEYLEKFLNTHKVAVVRELVMAEANPVVKNGSGKGLNAAIRIAQYLSAGSIEEELRIFSHYAGSAIDPRSLQITEIIGLSHTGMILDIISKTLKAVFGK